MSLVARGIRVEDGIGNAYGSLSAFGGYVWQSERKPCSSSELEPTIATPLGGGQLHRGIAQWSYDISSWSASFRWEPHIHLDPSMAALQASLPPWRHRSGAPLSVGWLTSSRASGLFVVV